MIALVLLALALQTPAVTTADSVLEARTREVSAVLRCPVCQGLSIQDSPSELSLQMKDVVRQQLRAGKSPEEVKAYFVSKYGEWILLEPKASGMNLLVYTLPIILVLGGAAFIWLNVRKWSRQPSSASAAPVNEEEEELTV
jgi:cytochrome c-type biogenesis protein CcmH